MTAGGIYALALVLTIVIETGLACLLRPRQARRLLIDVPLLNLLTHPLLHFALERGLPLAVGEVLVMAVETLVYWRVTRLPLRWSLALAVTLNAVTWALGSLLFPGA